MTITEIMIIMDFYGRRHINIRRRNPQSHETFANSLRSSTGYDAQ